MRNIEDKKGNYYRHPRVYLWKQTWAYHHAITNAKKS